VARSIVLASSNPAKREQLRWLLAGLDLEPVVRDIVGVAEDAPDLAGNAALKALAHSHDGLAIASDGGLEVPALAGRWDPLLTHRQGQARLRELTASLHDRRVCWAEAVAIAEHGTVLASWSASATSGLLAPEPWPQPRAFWVWDIFVFPELGKTWAQLTPDERERVDVTWTTLRREVSAFLAPMLAG
jgi:inosine/xanthosine triphosphate pyrophosphatase family protein